MAYKDPGDGNAKLVILKGPVLGKGPPKQTQNVASN